MSTEITEIEGTCHVHSPENKLNVSHVPAHLSLNRFFNGKGRGPNIQVTIMQSSGECAYIHLSPDQCMLLGEILQNCFDYEQYPSD